VHHVGVQYDRYDVCCSRSFIVDRSSSSSLSASSTSHHSARHTISLLVCARVRLLPLLISVCLSLRPKVTVRIGRSTAITDLIVTPAVSPIA